MSFGKTIKRIRLAQGLTQDDLYERVDLELSAGLISRIENDRNVPSLTTARAVCDALGVSVSDVLVEADGGTPVEIYKQTAAYVPVVSWVQAGNFNDSPPAHMASSWIPFDSKRNNLYALKVQGDSMTSATGLSFPEGVHIIVDPGRQPENKSLVIARIDGSNEATFKQLIMDGPFVYLRPLNNTYPMITVSEEHHIHGVVIGMYWKDPLAN